ncbi:uncharacterized protein LOC142937437 [Anarhichas minor]|uniref:uncharacterized protein LOC142937437 n=1 Tax=Anarhichas minor TaxID=65739 RepID=UPI003F73B2DD
MEEEKAKDLSLGSSADSADPLTPEISPVDHEGASSNTEETLKQYLREYVQSVSKTSSALTEICPIVTARHCSSKDSSSARRRIINFQKSESESEPLLSQKSSSKNETFPAVNISCDTLHRIISETHRASATDPSDSMFHQSLLRPLSQAMRSCYSAAASTLRVLQDNTAELLQGFRTGGELREGEPDLSAPQSVSAQGSLSRPVLHQPACSQSINTSDADPIASQSQACAPPEHLCRLDPHDVVFELTQIGDEIPVHFKGASCRPGEDLKLDTWGFLVQPESKTSSARAALGEVWRPVTVENFSPDVLDFGSLLSPQSEMTQPKPPSGSQYCPGQRAQTQSIAPTVAGPPCPQARPTVIQDSTVCTEGSGAQDAVQRFSVEPESELEMDSPVTAVNYSVTNAMPERGHLSPPWSRGDSSCLSRSHSMPSLSLITSEEIRTLRRAESSPDALLISSSEEFTPDITADENNDETFRFRCSCPGLYQCSVTGLVFHMGGEGDVVYRTVPWDWRLLVQHRKKPAGPLFDIKCEQQSVRGLHLPHCEIRSTGGCDFLSVAHVKDEGVEFISPNKATETHVVISVTGFSAFGNVKDEDSPPDPVRALVLLFYRPQADPDPESLLNVLLLPRNVVLRDVLRIRKKTVGDESYIETSPHCKLHPKQEYTLSASPEDHQVLVQPTEAEFDSDNYDNYFPSFQVTWETTLKHIKLFLRDTNGSHTAWERRVCLSAAGVRRSCGPSALNLPSCEKLRVTRSSFIEGISGPMLKSLLDKLLEKTVMNDSERESADEMPNKRDKARFVVDTVRSKGEAASSEMIEMLCEADTFLCEHLGLT